MNKSGFLALACLAACVGPSADEPIALDAVGPSAPSAVDFLLEDVNATSVTFGDQIGLAGAVQRSTPTAWYFGHSS